MKFAVSFPPVFTRASWFALARLLALGLAWPAMTQAQNANVTVNAGQAIRTVDERVFGANSVIWDPQANSAQTISLLQAAGLRTVRVPGGSLSDEYHWRVNKTLSNTWTWSSHFGKFVDLISNLNANAIVTVNYGTGTPEEAAALVAYLNSPVGSNVTIGSDGSYNWGASGDWAGVRASTSPSDEMSHLRIGRAAPMGARYFEIGNECYGSWETDQQAVKNDPTTYANRVQAYMAKMKAVDPSIKIGVVVVTSGENANYKNWTPMMLGRLNTLGAIPDFIIYHRYPQAPNQESDSGLLQNAAAWASAATDLRQQLTTYLGAAGAGVEILVTENNSVFSNPGKQSTSLVNGLYLADSIANVMKTEINGFMWWAVRNGPPPTSTTNQSASLYGWRMYGDYGMISTPFSEGAVTYASSYNEPYPTYYAMKVLQYFARNGDTIVPATSSNNLLAVFAAKNSSGALRLLVINKDPNNTLSAAFALTGFAPPSVATSYSYGKPQDDAAKPGGVGSPDIGVAQVNVAGANFTTSFGPYSMTVLSFDGAPPVQNVPPAFTTQPANQTVLVGNAMTFTVAANGTPAPSFQWRKNGVNIAGATTTSLVIGDVQAADAGSYTAVATNVAGAVASTAATLTVTPRVTGDFDGNGSADAGWQNPALGQRSLWRMNGTVFSGGSDLGVVDANWRMVATGDFNSDGKRDILWRNTATGELFLWYMDGLVHVGSVSLGVVATEWSVAAAADFNADGKPDILWQNTSTGERYLWFMSGTAHIADASLGMVGTTWSITAAADFNADNKPDILWQNTFNGERYVWFMDGATHAGNASLAFVPTEWSIAAAADFNGDNKPDLLWQNTSTGERYVWFMDGTTHAGNADLGVLPTYWSIAAAADFSGDGQPEILWQRLTSAAAVNSDFNADGKSDILWQNTVTGERYVWFMDGAGHLGSASLGIMPVQWSMAAAADFNPDGKTDILWQNTATGERYLWFMDGAGHVGSASLGTVPMEWSVAAAADFSADGKTDILWQNTTTGDRYIWYMDGAGHVGSVSLGIVPTEWSIAAAADFNADGKPDILWQNTTTGERYLWFMSGAGHISGASLGTVPIEWSIAAAADFNADGKPDILWQNTTTGERYLWFMNGMLHTADASLGIVSTDWKIVR